MSSIRSKFRGRQLLAATSLLLLSHPAAHLARAADAPAAKANHPPRAVSSDEREVHDYILSMERVDRFVAASEALDKLGKAEPAFAARMETLAGDKDLTLDAKVKSIETAAPEAVAAIRAAGMTTREYVVASVALFTDILIVGLKRQGTIHEYGAGILPENAAFLEKNWDAIQPKLARFARREPRGEGDADERDEDDRGDDSAATGGDQD